MSDIVVTPEDMLDLLRQRELMEIAAFASGQATAQDWRELAGMLAVCRVMAESGIGPEALEACDRMEVEMESSRVRFNSTGRMGATGPGLTAMRDVYQYHDLQRQSVTRGDYERHIRAASVKAKVKPPQPRQEKTP
jgi:hypothetical protein